MSSAWSVLAKTAVGFVVVLLLSLGLCGLSLASNGSQNLAMASIAGMVVGGAGLLLCGAIAIGFAIASAVRSRTPPPPPVVPPPQ